MDVIDKIKLFCAFTLEESIENSTLEDPLHLTALRMGKINMSRQILSMIEENDERKG